MNLEKLPQELDAAITFHHSHPVLPSSLQQGGGLLGIFLLGVFVSWTEVVAPSPSSFPWGMCTSVNGLEAAKAHYFPLFSNFVSFNKVQGKDDVRKELVCEETLPTMIRTFHFYPENSRKASMEMLI